MKWLKLLKKAIDLDLSKEFAYKTNAIIKMFAFVLLDIISPVVMLLIYTVTAGIPGWTFNEFLVFQGSLILVFGIGHTFFILLPYKVMWHIKNGEFDKFLIKPYNTLGYLLTQSFLVEGSAEIFTGLAILTYAFIQLSIPVMSVNMLLFVLLIAAGALFQCAAMILVTSLSFLVVKSDALLNIHFKLSDFARYPLDIYNLSFRYFFTFFFPIAVSSFYPATALLKGMSIFVLFKVIIPIVVFFLVALVLWSWAMKKYTSAGG